MREADDLDIAALEGVNEIDLEAEDASNGAMDEQNLSYMEDPDDLDGRDALRAARGSDSEATAPGMYMEDLTPQDQVEDEDADPVGNGRD
jgi:hypothetical protein